MKIPLSLLQSFLSLNESVELLSETLTLLGLEIDGVHPGAPPFSGIVAARIIDTAPHPESKKLQIAQVTDGKNNWQIVCGAPNCRPGLVVALAKKGAILKKEPNDPWTIETTDIRNVKSEGMLCSGNELGIPESIDGILELPFETPLGTDLLSVLWDPVLEISLTPNLGHCMSALGVARELSAALKKPLQDMPIFEKDLATSSAKKRISLSIENPADCSLYACRFIDEVEIKPSPFWLQQTLLAAGFRPINNAVDISNYILLKRGHPLHAFDAFKLSGSQLRVCSLETSTSFKGLDGNTYDLPLGSLVISDAEKVVALAGILGGENSAVSEETTSIVLEGAVFAPHSIRKTSKALHLRTESAQRFEKGVDLQQVEFALNEACALFEELCNARIVPGIQKMQGETSARLPITLRVERVNRMLGTALSANEIQQLLERLQFKALFCDSFFEVFIPSFRHDISQEIDLIEEVARLYGYSHIQTERPLYTHSPIPHDPMFLFEKEIRTRLVGQGLQELITCDLISPSLASLSLQPLPPLSAPSAKSEEYSILRDSLLPGLLQVVQINLSQKNPSLQGFEVGRIHIQESNNHPIDLPMLGLVLTGSNAPPHWSRSHEPVDFYDLKGYLESLFETLYLPKPMIEKGTHPTFHPEQQAVLVNGEGVQIGMFGQLHPRTLEKLDIKQPVLFAEINLKALFAQKKNTKHMIPLSLYPSTQRDWTVTLPIEIPVSLLQTLESPSPLLEKIEVIDVYSLETHHRNVTLRFTYRDLYSTISSEVADDAHQITLESLKEKLRACNYTPAY